jgi:kynurenine formamidase
MSNVSSAGPKVSVDEFEQIFESVKNWGRWGADDRLGTLNLITPDHVRRAAATITEGRSVSMAIPINTVAGPDNASPAIHHMTQMHDIPVGTSKVTFSMDFLGMECHGDCHTHMDALCHIAYDQQMYNGLPADDVTSRGSRVLHVDDYSTGIIGRGVLLDVPRHRGVDWLEPGEAVTRAELEEVERAQGVRLEEGDLFAFRTGHHARRKALGAWDNSYDGEGKAGLHVDTIPWMHERGIAGFLPDGDGETVPSVVEGVMYPIHPLQVVAMGMFVSDSLQLEDIGDACAELGRHEFMVTVAPLRIVGGTGCPFNPIAIL